MSKWSRLKVAMLTAVATLSAVQLGGGCALWNGLESVYPRILQLVTIANIFD